MDVIDWDPIALAGNTAEEVLSTAHKRQIDNILKSYTGFFDPFCELIQNAMDAVDARKEEMKEAEYRKHLWIEVNLQEKSFSVTDNGIGFTKGQFQTFLAPNISFKGNENSRGNKGVGATYLAYGFNFLQMGTKTPDYTQVVEIRNGRQWADDESNVAITRPRVTKSDLIHKVFDSVDRGSTFTLRFIGENIRPKELSWMGATNAEQWKAMLLIKTPLGHISFPPGTKGDVFFDLVVVDNDGQSTAVTDVPARYLYPHTVVSASIDLQQIRDEQEKRHKLYQDMSKLPDKFKNLNGIYALWKTEDIVSIASFQDEAAVDLIKKFAMQAYGFFCYSVGVWDQYNDESLKVRKGQRLLRGGLQLATNHMPQGDLITIPLTTTIGYQNQAHVVVHFQGADPDLGRKGFQPDLKEIAQKIAVSLVNRLKEWRPCLRRDTGAVPSLEEGKALHEWKVDQEKHEKEHPLIIKNKNFFIPINEVSITSTPLSEQDVVVLLNQLIAGGVIRGVKMMATSQTNRYDSVFRYFISEPLINHVFNMDQNPLGVEKTPAKPASSEPLVLEYKYDMDALIREFENEDKSEKDIDLVVAWNIGTEWKKRYSLTPLLDLKNLQHRPAHGVTHIFSDAISGDRRFYGIILSELVEYLDNPHNFQATIAVRYGDS